MGGCVAQVLVPSAGAQPPSRAVRALGRSHALAGAMGSLRQSFPLSVLKRGGHVFPPAIVSLKRAKAWGPCVPSGYFFFFSAFSFAKIVRP